MIIRLDTRWVLNADRWAEAAGTDPGDAARDAAWHLSDALESIPYLNTDGCPADLQALPGWGVDQDILGTVTIEAPWAVECPAADWVAWRADPGFYDQAFDVPEGRAREDLTRIAVEGMVSLGILSEAQAAMTLTHPYRYVYDHAWRTRAHLRPGQPARGRR